MAGFLGINGAGKTTTLEMLTGEIIPTQGTAYLDGLNVLYDQKSIRSRIGTFSLSLSLLLCLILYPHIALLTLL